MHLVLEGRSGSGCHLKTTEYWNSFGNRLCTLSVLLRSTRPSTLHEIVKCISFQAQYWYLIVGVIQQQSTWMTSQSSMAWFLSQQPSATVRHSSEQRELWQWLCNVWPHHYKHCTGIVIISAAEIND